MTHLRVLTLLLSLPALGCGSIEKTFIHPRHGSVHPYMGVAHTVDFACGRGLFAGHPVAFAIAGVDLPFSFVADTVFLPYTIPAWLRDRRS
jgi:uncharacterized protein YceK